MLLRLAVLLCLLIAPGAQAACNGQDLRPTLTSSEKAAVAERLKGQPFAEGNHWLATQGPVSIHVIGTLHLDTPRNAAVVRGLRPFIENAELLMLETTAEDRETLKETFASDPSLLMMADTTLPTLLTEIQWQAVAAAVKARGIPPMIAARFQPWYVSILLAVPPCAAGPQIDEGGIDSRLEALARSKGIARWSLEAPEDALQLFAAQSRQSQLDLMLASVTDEEAAEDMQATLIAGYFDEKPLESWAVSEVLAARIGAQPEGASTAMAALESALLAERNHAWLPRILDAARDHNKIVVAVGAAHLPGHSGLLALLRDDGFQLTRKPF